MAALNFPHENLNIGREYSANGKTWVWDGTSWKLKYVTSGATTFIGLSDTPNTFDNGKWLKAENGALVWTTAPSGGTADGNTTYTQSAVVSGDNVNLRLTDSSSPAVNDDILITAGTNIEFDNVTAAGFTIKSTASGGINDIIEDTTPQLGGNLDLNSKDITGSGNITFTGVLTTRRDDISNIAQTALTIGRVQNLDSFIVKADGNVTTIGMVEATSFKKTNGTSSQFLKADGSVDTNTYITQDSDTTYTLPVAQSGDNVTLKIKPDGDTANQNTQTVTFIAGNNIELTTNGTANTITITGSGSSGGTNTTYGITAEDGSDVDKKAIRLTASNPSSTQDIELEGGTNITLTRSGNTIIITGTSGGGSGSDGNTTYGVSIVDGDVATEKKIRLSSVDPAGDDDILVAEGDHIEITRVGDKLTWKATSSIEDAIDVDFEGTATANIPDNKILKFSTGKWRLADQDAAKTYTISAVDGDTLDTEKIRLSDGSAASYQHIKIQAGNYLAISRPDTETIKIDNQATLAGLLDTWWTTGIANNKILKYSTSGGQSGTGAWVLADDNNTEYLEFSGTSAGLVPLSTSNVSDKFLRSDGNWVDAPAATLDAVLGAGYQSTKSMEVGDIQCADLNVTANDITLNSDFTGSSPSANVSLKVERGNSADVSIRWNESTDKWQYTNDGSTFADIGGSTVDLSPYVKKTEAASLTLARTGSNNFIVVNTESYFDLNTSAQCTIDAGAQFVVDAVGQIQLHSDSYVETKSTRFDIKSQDGNTLWARINGSGLTLDGGLIDKDGGLGAAGEILSSTGSKIEWIPSPGDLDLDDVLENGSTSNRSMSVGNVTCATLNVTSPTVNLNSDFSGSSPSENVSLKVQRGNSADVDIRWNESTNKWQFTNDGTSYTDMGGSTTDTNDYVSAVTLDTNNGYNLKTTRSGSNSLPQITTDLSALRGITIQNDGTTLGGVATTLNFKGASVTASGTGSTKEITITAASSGVIVQEQGNPLSTSGTTLNFMGDIVTASGTGAVKTITVATPNLTAVTNQNAETTNAVSVGNFTCATLNVTSSTINLNSDFNASNPSETCYLKVERGNSSDVSIRWNESSDKWQYTNNGSTYLDMGGTTLPSYQSGKYLTTNGSSLSWDDPDNNYVTGASWSSSTGQLTLTRGGSSSLSSVTVGVSNLVTYLNANLSGGDPTIRTDNGGDWHYLTYVDNSTDNQSQTLKLDSGLQYYPSANWLRTDVINCSKIYDWSNDAGDQGQFLMSKGGSSSWQWSQYIHQESNGEIRLSGPTGSSTSLEGAHLQFEDMNGSTSYAIDVYRNATSGSTANTNKVLRFIDQSTGTERFSIGPNGQWGIGHINRDFGDLGQVMVSRGPDLSPQWANHNAISGSEAFATNAQGATADVANAEIDHIYSQLNAIGNDDSITTVAQLKTALLALVRN